MRFRSCAITTTLAVTLCAARGQTAEPAVTITLDASRPGGQLCPAWRFFGYDEPNYTYMKDGKALLADLATLGRQTVFVRTHNLLTSGDGTPALKWGSTDAYTEDAQGRPHFDWTIVDRIFDTYLERGLKPYVQIGFMPQALSQKPEPYQHHWSPQGGNISTGWAYPPSDYRKWGELVYQWVTHCASRYGRSEVERWYWEVWNEPNIMYWRETAEDYHRLYDHAADTVKRALPAVRVGGPEIAGTRTPEAARFLRDFIEHCLCGTNHATGKVGAPLDFLAFHAKGSPRIALGHVQMGIATQLQDIDRGFEVVASFPELKGRPIVIGESDPDGSRPARQRSFPRTPIATARSTPATPRPPTPAPSTWQRSTRSTSRARSPGRSSSRISRISPASACWPRGGMDLPVLNVFRMLGLMGGRRLKVESSADAGVETLRLHSVRQGPEIMALAGLEDRTLGVLVWHYHDDDLPGPDAAVDLCLRGLPAQAGSVLVQQYRIDRDHSNAFEAWKRMGSPPRPTSQQLAALKRSAQLEAITSPCWQRPVAGASHSSSPCRGRPSRWLRCGGESSCEGL